MVAAPRLLIYFMAFNIQLIALPIFMLFPLSPVQVPSSTYTTTTIKGQGHQKWKSFPMLSRAYFYFISHLTYTFFFFFWLWRRHMIWTSFDHSLVSQMQEKRKSDFNSRAFHNRFGQLERSKENRHRHGTLLIRFEEDSLLKWFVIVTANLTI